MHVPKRELKDVHAARHKERSVHDLLRSFLGPGKTCINGISGESCVILRVILAPISRRTGVWAISSGCNAYTHAPPAYQDVNVEATARPGGIEQAHAHGAHSH